MFEARRTPLAWKNLTHDRRRLLLALGGVGFAVLLMSMQVGFRNALFDSQVELLRRLDADLVIASRALYTLSARETFPRRRLYQALACSGVASASPLYIEAHRGIWKNPRTGQGNPIRVLAFDPDDSVLDIPEVQKMAAQLKSPGTVLVDRLSKSEYGYPQPGEETDLADRRVRVAGLFSLGTDFANDGSLIMSAETYRLLFPRPALAGDALGAVDIGLLKLDPASDSSAVLARVREILPEDVKVFSKDELVEQELDFWRASTPIGFTFGLGTAMGFVVGMIICYQVLYADIADHLAEFATLKAMGYRARYFLGLVLEEALLLSLLGFVPGLLVSAVLYAGLAWLTGLLLHVTVARASLILLLTVSMCVASGCLAVRKLLATDPAELF